MDGYQLKKILEGIIDIAYAEATEQERREYKAFYIKLMPKQFKTKVGDCWYEKRLIRLFDIKGRDTVGILVMALHELAHHIDFCQRGTSDHQKPFYEVYRKLLYAGLDCGYFRKEDYLNSKYDTREFNKVCKMLRDYTGPSGTFKRGFIRVNVRNAYTIKDILKTKNFRFDSVTKDWYIEAPEIKRDEITSFLDGLSADYEITTPSDMSFRREVPMPDSWCRHTFTEEEKETLLNRGWIYAEDFWSGKAGAHFSCHLWWDGSRFTPKFSNRR